MNVFKLVKTKQRDHQGGLLGSKGYSEILRGLLSDYWSREAGGISIRQGILLPPGRILKMWSLKV